jgi:hypothetical protein
VVIERQGRDTTSQRDLFVLDVQASDQVPSDPELASPRFVCLLAWDARTATAEEIAAVAQKLIGGGGVYIAAWGPDCGRVHDIIDEVVIGHDPPATELGPVMTTWHETEDLAGAISFVLQCAVPDEAFLTGCGSTLAVAIGSREWAEQIREAFSDPTAFIRDHA